MNILLDATGLDTEELRSKFSPFRWEGRELDARKALEELSNDVLDQTYWLCIFAVNEHMSICGDCWICKPQTPEQLRAPRCQCGKEKFNPCTCGALKYKIGDP